MKKVGFKFFTVAMMMVFLLSSCSSNRFAAKKNHQPRVSVEVAGGTDTLAGSFIENIVSPVKQVHASTQQATSHNIAVEKSNPTKETLSEKMIKTFFPKKMKVLAPIIHSKKLPLKKGQKVEMDGDQVTGLVINLLALVIAITSIFMVFGMGSGNVWVFFVVGMILAICALIIGFIGKHLPWRGFAIGAIAIAILAIILLIVFMVAVTVFGLIY